MSTNIDLKHNIYVEKNEQTANLFFAGRAVFVRQQGIIYLWDGIVSQVFLTKALRHYVLKWGVNHGK